MASYHSNFYFCKVKKFTALLIFSLLLSISYATAQPASSNTPPQDSAFKPGEWFQFRIHYGFLNASFATIELQKSVFRGDTLYHAIGIGKTVGLARLFYKVDDRYETYFRSASVSPVYFIRDIDEGGYTKNVRIDFNKHNNIAQIRDIKNNSFREVKTAEDAQDMLSSFYYLRNHLDFENLEKGSSVSINMFFDAENYNFKLAYLGRETIETKFGHIPCLKFRPYVQSGRVFKESESLTLWVSADKNKMPVRIVADLAVGSLDADLHAFKGLNHPLEIEFYDE